MKAGRQYISLTRHARTSHPTVPVIMIRIIIIIEMICLHLFHRLYRPCIVVVDTASHKKLYTSS